MAKGGPRPGAGRPKGSGNLPKIRDHISKKQVQELVEMAMERAKESDRVLTFLLEQIYGKAPQSIDHTTGGEKLTISFDPIFDASRNSEEGSST